MVIFFKQIFYWQTFHLVFNIFCCYCKWSLCLAISGCRTWFYSQNTFCFQFYFHIFPAFPIRPSRNRLLTKQNGKAALPVYYISDLAPPIHLLCLSLHFCFSSPFLPFGIYKFPSFCCVSQLLRCSSDCIPMYIHINRENLVGSEITNKDHLISAGQGFGCLLEKVVVDTVGRYSDHIVNKGTCLLYFN